MKPAQQTNGRAHVSKGFTLIELMIVVAIVAILAAIAYPSYRSSVIKSDRSDAKVALTRAAQALERCYAENHDYTADSCPDFPQTSPNQYYSIAVGTDASGNSQLTVSTYTLVATPKAGSPQQDDEECASLSLDSTGRQTSKNNAGTATTDCW